MKTINDTVKITNTNGIAIVEINAPPVNALGAKVRKGIFEAIHHVLEIEDVKAIVISCQGRTFSVGADINEFGKPRIPPSLPDVLSVIENSEKPIIVAIHGMALGGGLELAMAAHYRIAAHNAHCGLPEVNLGILPGAGGTQRLPRLVGVQKALEFITSGKKISASTALKMGLVDKLVDPNGLLEEAVKYAQGIVANNSPLKKIRELTDKVSSDKNYSEIFDKFRTENARKFRGFLAPEYIIRAIEAAVSLPFDEGMALERNLLDELLAGPQTAALRHVFFAERKSGKIPKTSSDNHVASILKVGVIGAGTMGGGIAMNFLNIGLPVVIMDMSQTALERGRVTIRKNYENSLRRGKITERQIDDRMALLSGTIELSDMADCDLVIEAVFENLEIKKSIFTQLDGIAKPGAILATNTSYLNVDEIAAVTNRPEYVIGLHFFSPANIMRLLEIVKASKTNDLCLATAASLAKRIDKVGVVVGNGWGFVGNRILQARQGEAEKLILEGASPWNVDKVLYDFGFPMGPFQMRDLVGLDVGWNKNDTSSRTVREILNEMGRHGQKTNGGFYDYDDQRTRTPSKIAETVIIDFAKKHNIVRRDISDHEIHDRTLFAMVNEGAKILEEGIAACASDIDTVWVTGYGWPKYLGGPMFWADQIGLKKVVNTLLDLEKRFGDHFKPAALLIKLAEEGGSFATE
ncbi:MAG: 3-hydroxyacyl-CoA dehydrogenase [Robiginitomaculum sp.]|nr:MAG: 3-hydroxyacyl-CoA dehydrogenase [Robiginitomaculum sp.]